MLKPSEMTDQLHKEKEIMEGVIRYAKMVESRKAESDIKLGLSPEYLNLKHIEIQVAKKYIKLWWVRTSSGSKFSIHSFIDKNTGAIYKPASTKAPAKHARGNVLSPTGGKESLSHSLGYYVRYL